MRPRSMRVIRVWLLVVFVLAGARSIKAESGGDYPVRYAPQAPAERARALAEFRKRNGTEWHATIDEFGFVSNVSVSDPSWLSQDPEQNRIVTDDEKRVVEEFIRKNADSFGVDDPGTFRLTVQSSDTHATPGGPTSLPERRCWAAQDISGRGFYTIPAGSGWRRAAFNAWENNIQMTASRFKGAGRHAVLTIWGHFWPRASVPVTPRLTSDDILGRFVGTEYKRVEEVGRPACDPPPTCPPAPPPRIITEKIRREDLSIELAPHLCRTTPHGPLELRLTYIVTIRVSNFGTKLLDAMTGEELPQR